jgi:DNA-binding NarL/FixJ family response regulator
MTIWKLTTDDVEAVMTQLRKGKSLKQVADDLGISEEMAACAVRQWPSIRKQSLWPLG